MKPALKPALRNVDDALARLESAIEKRLQNMRVDKAAPRLDLGVRNERDVNNKIAAKLDSTISRLEMLLSEE